MIRTTGLTKRFGRILAVDGLDLDVREGDIYGFLGANGSGKTTTVRMLLGLVLATSGRSTCWASGCRGPRATVLPQVGALVEGPAAYGHLSGRANLALFDAMGPAGGRSHPAGRVDDVLDQVGLAGVDSRPVRAYSLGMRQRLGLAGALLRRPRLLVLDEPTNGLDPQGIREIRRLLLELNAAGTTVFLSSHLLAEVEQMCTRVGVLDRGRLVIQESSSVLQRPTGRIFVRTRDVALVRALLDGQVEHHDEDSLLVRVDDPAALNARLVNAGVRVEVLAPERHTLEDVVLAATRRVPTGWTPVIAVELRKLFRSRRTWVTIAADRPLPTLVAVLLALTDLGPRPGTGPAFLSAVLTDGTLFPLAAIAIVLPLFLPIAVAVVAGDSIAGEAQAGTLRYVLIRPVGRSRLLVANWSACMAFVLLRSSSSLRWRT